MYFMIDPDLLRLEKMMTQIPHFPPPSSGLLIHISEETPASTSHNKLMRDTMRYIRNPEFLQRFQEYRQERESSAVTYRGMHHKELFEREVRKRKNPAADLLCVLYLLTADCRLWRRVQPYAHRTGVQFQGVRLGDISPDAYTLYMTAKDLYCGTKHITIRDLADRELVSTQLFELVCEAMTIRRYGLAACDSRTKTEVGQ